MIDFELLVEYSPLFVQGALMSLYIAFCSCVLGIMLGGVSGIILSGNSKILKSIVMIYVTIIRGTPMLIQVAAVYFILIYLGFPISALYSAILSIGLNSGAYMSKIVLAGIKSVGKGQAEAGKVLGLSGYQIMTLIILPQALRNMIPAFGNEFVTLVKDSSLASTIGVYELAKQGQVILANTYDAPTIYVMLALIYLCITSVISLLILYIEKKLNTHAHR